MKNTNKEILKVFLKKKGNKVLLYMSLIILLIFLITPVENFSFMGKLKKSLPNILFYFITFGKGYINATKRVIKFGGIGFIIFNLLLLFKHTYTLEYFVGSCFTIAILGLVYLRLLFKQDYDKLLAEVNLKEEQDKK